MTAIMFVDPDTRSTVNTSNGGSGGGSSTSGVVTIGGAIATIGVTLANVSGATPLPVSFGSGGSTMDVSIVSASNGTPINVALPNVTSLNPLPVTFPTVGGMNVTVVNGSPIPVTFPGGGMNVTIAGVTTATPLPVTINGGGTLNTNITNASLATTVTSGTVNATITNVTSTNPLPVSFSTAGGMDVTVLNTSLPVTLAGLISGEDQTNNWLKTADGATQGYNLHPAGSGSVAAVPADTVLGASGASGDYLKKLVFNVFTANSTSAFLIQDGDVLATSGSSGTAPSASVTISVVATAAVTLTQNQLVGRVIMITYTPTGAAGTVKLRRKITGHAAFASATSLSFTVTHAVPTGGVISQWQIEGPKSFEILPFSTPLGMYQIDLGEVSTTGAWRLAVDPGVSVHAIGKFT